MSDEQNRPVGPLTTEHLAYLWEQGVLTTPIEHLGPMPITRVTMLEDHAKRDLIAHGFIDRDNKLTDLGHQIIGTLIAPDESWWGIILLRAQANSTPIQVPEEWARFGLERSVMTIPRVYFTVSYSGGQQCAIAVRSGDNVSLAMVPARPPRERHAGDILMGILNPRREWLPAASFPELVMPHDVTASLGRVGETGDELLDSQVRAQRRKAYSERGLSEDEVDRVVGLLDNTSGVAASMQIQHMDSMGRTTPSAISIELLYGQGAIVLYPFSGTDRQWWLRACKADARNVAIATKAVQGLPHFKYDVGADDERPPIPI